MYGIKHGQARETSPPECFSWSEISIFATSVFFLSLFPATWLMVALYATSRTSVHHASPASSETCSPSALWSFDRHSPFVSCRGPKIFIFMIQNRGIIVEKGREETREKFKCKENRVEGKKEPQVTRLWERNKPHKLDTRGNSAYICTYVYIYLEDDENKKHSDITVTVSSHFTRTNGTWNL